MCRSSNVYRNLESGIWDLINSSRVLSIKAGSGSMMVHNSLCTSFEFMDVLSCYV